MSVLKKVLKNILSNWVSLVVNVLISFFLAPYIVHKLGNVYYGIWAVMMQFTGYLYLLDFGIRESVIRYVARYKAREEDDSASDIISTALLQYLVVTLLSFLLIAVFTAMFPYIFTIDANLVLTARIIIVLTGLTIAQTFVFNIYTGILMGIQRYDVINSVGIVFMFIRLGLILYFLGRGYGILALAVIQLVVSLGASIVIWIWTRKLYSFKIALRKSTIVNHKKIWNYSFNVFINNISQKVIFYTDAMVIGIFLPPTQITFYAIAGSLIEYVRRLLRLMTQVFNPLTSEMDSLEQVDQIKTVMYKGSKYSFLIGAPICIAFIFIGKEFISLWMGSEFVEQSWPVLAILSVTMLISLPHFTVLNVMYGMNKHGLISGFRVAEAGMNLVLSLILIRTYGIVGVACGTAIPHALFVMIVLPYFIWRTTGIGPVSYFMSAYLKPVLITAPFTFGCIAVAQYWSSGHVVTLIIKLGLLYAFHFCLSLLIFMGHDEKIHVKALFQRS